MRFVLLVLLGLAPFAKADGVDNARQLLINRCGKCHGGPFLNFSKYPFFSDTYTTESELIAEALRRAKLPDRKRMPPVNYPALTPPEIELLEGYLNSLAE